jgi:stage III sporulation protein AA
VDPRRWVPGDGRAGGFPHRAAGPGAATAGSGPAREPADPAEAGPEAALLAFVAPRVRDLLVGLLAGGGPPWHEVRLRRGGPVQVVTASGDLWPGPDGRAAPGPDGAAVCWDEDFDRTVSLVTRASVYAWEEELARGFCTLPGGHRVGFAGRAVLEGGRVVSQRSFTSLCLRLARQVPGAADPVLPRIRDGGGGLRPTLVFGPPGSGKTTLLRDLARQASRGRPDLGLRGLRVAVVDERSELAGCRDGRPQFDLGPRTDVLDGVPKDQGMAMALRALGPEVLVCDEVGRPEDAEAVEDAARAGVAVVASAHAGSAEELRRRPVLERLLAGGAFPCLVRLGPDRRVAEVLAPPGVCRV